MSAILPANIHRISTVQRSLANLIAISEHTGNPIVVTQRGEATAVVIAARHWQVMQDELARLRALASTERSET